MSYEVHLDVFDGPFELLLQLITAQQVDLYEVSLSEIVDGFLAELARLSVTDLETTTQFLLIAATLVELKCRRLLPGRDDVDLDEELALFEARDYLLARLVECKTFSAASRVLAALEQAATRSYPRRAGPDERLVEPVADLLAGVTLAQIRQAALAGMAPRPTASVPVAHVHEDEVSVAATVEALCRRLPVAGTTSFVELTAGAPSRAHVVACFLALLELYKQDLVDLDQAVTFGHLLVRWRGAGQPTDRFERSSPPLTGLVSYPAPGR